MNNKIFKISEVLKNGKLINNEEMENAPSSMLISNTLANLVENGTINEIEEELKVLDDFISRNNIKDKGMSSALSSLFSLETLGLKMNPKVKSILSHNPDLAFSLFRETVETGVLSFDDIQSVNLDIASTMFILGVEKENELKAFIDNDVLINAYKKYSEIETDISSNMVAFDGFKDPEFLFPLKSKIENHLKHTLNDLELDKFHNEFNNFKENKDLKELYFGKNFFYYGKYFMESSFSNADANPHLSGYRLGKWSKTFEEYQEINEEANRFYKENGLHFMSAFDKLSLKSKTKAPRWLLKTIAIPTLLKTESDGSKTPIFHASPITGAISFTKQAQEEKLALSAAIHYGKAQGWNKLVLSHNGSEIAKIHYFRNMLKVVESEKPRVYKLEDIILPKKYNYLVREELERQSLYTKTPMKSVPREEVPEAENKPKEDYSSEEKQAYWDSKSAEEKQAHWKNQKKSKPSR